MTGSREAREDSQEHNEDRSTLVGDFGLQVLTVGRYVTMAQHYGGGVTSLRS